MKKQLLIISSAIVMSFSAFSATVDSLIVDLPFKGDANDWSGNDHHGTATGVSLVPGRAGDINGAYEFTGATSQTINIPHSSQFESMNSAFTISAVIYPHTITSTQRNVIISKLNNSTREIVVRFEPDGRLGVHFNSGGTLKFHTSDSVVNTINEWQHVVITWDGNIMSSYVNNVLVDQTDLTGATPSFAGGDFKVGNLVGGERFDGVIDHIKMWSRSLTVSEIELENEKSAFGSDLLVHLPLSGSTDDESGNDFHGVISGTSILTTDYQNTADEAYEFNGSSAGSIDVAHETIFSTMSDQFTISMLVKPDVLVSSQRRVLVSKFNQGGNKRELFFRFEQDGRLSAHFDSGGLKFHTIPTVVNTVGAWQHVTLWWNGNIMRTYVDGELEHESDFTGSSITFAAGAFRFGSFGNNELLDGAIDELKIYNRALQESEITNLGLITSLLKAKKYESFSVYPNPVSEEIQLPSHLDGAEVIINDIMGNEIMKSSLQGRLLVDGLKEGVYFMTANKDGKAYRSRFIKN